MKNTNDNFDQMILSFAVIAMVLAIIFLVGDKRDTNYVKTIIQPTQTPSLTKTETMDQIESDFESIDADKFETEIDNGLTKLGNDTINF